MNMNMMTRPMYRDHFTNCMSNDDLRAFNQPTTDEVLIERFRNAMQDRAGWNHELVFEDIIHKYDDARILQFGYSVWFSEELIEAMDLKYDMNRYHQVCQKDITWYMDRRNHLSRHEVGVVPKPGEEYWRPNVVVVTGVLYLLPTEEDAGLVRLTDDFGLWQISDDGEPVKMPFSQEDFAAACPLPCSCSKPNDKRDLCYSPEYSTKVMKKILGTKYNVNVIVNGIEDWLIDDDCAEDVYVATGISEWNGTLVLTIDFGVYKISGNTHEVKCLLNDGERFANLIGRPVIVENFNENNR